MRVRALGFLAVVPFLVLGAALLGDSVRLTSGELVHGKVVKKTAAEVEVAFPDGTSRTIPAAQVDQLIAGSTYQQFEKKWMETEGKGTADAFFDLGTWCKQKKLLPEAKRAWEKAVALDGAHEKAHKALGHELVDGQWKTEDEIMKAQGKVQFRGRWIDADKVEAAQEEWEAAQYKRAHAFSLDIGVGPDVSAARLQEVADLFASFAPDFWLATEGNFYFDKVTASDMSQKGNVRIEEVDVQFIAGGGQTFPGSHMLVAGRCSPYTFVHEAGHLFFWLPDEYAGTDKHCPTCIMIGGDMKGFHRGNWRYCDASDHTAKGCGPCWPEIQKRFKHAVHPNTDYPKEPPKPEVRIVNGGA